MGQPLSDFITSTLAEIATGVRNARQNGIVVAPVTIETNVATSESNPSTVRFEVEVSSEMTGGTGVSVLNLADLSGKAARKSGHRITFEVPVHFWAEWKDKS